MSKSAVYSANTTSQTITSGGVVNFGNPVRRFGCNCNMTGGNAVVDGAGYYDVEASASYTSSVAGTTTFQIYVDGVAVQGASQTITTDSATRFAIVIPAIIRTLCNCESTITVVMTGVSGSITDATIKVVKL